MEPLATGFLEHFLTDFPHDVHTILTGGQRRRVHQNSAALAVNKKNKPPGKPSGEAPL